MDRSIRIVEWISYCHHEKLENAKKSRQNLPVNQNASKSDQDRLINNLTLGSQQKVIVEGAVDRVGEQLIQRFFGM